MNAHNRLPPTPILPVELVQEKKVNLCIYLFLFPEQDHVQMKILGKLIPCPDLLGNKFLVFNTKKRHNAKVNKRHTDTHQNN